MHAAYYIAYNLHILALVYPMFGNNHHLQPSWNVDTLRTVCLYHLILKKQRCEWCISSKKWPAFSNLSRICFSFWVGCQPGNTTPWRRRCPKECPQEGLIDRCSMRPSDLGCTGWTNQAQHDFMVETIAQHLRSTLTSWNTCTICTTHTSIIVSYLYMRICHPMKWWIRDDTLFLHAPFKTAKWLMDLLPKLKKKKPMPRGKLKDKNSQSLWIPVIRCQEFAPLVYGKSMIFGPICIRLHKESLQYRWSDILW